MKETICQTFAAVSTIIVIAGCAHNSAQRAYEHDHTAVLAQFKAIEEGWLNPIQFNSDKQAVRSMLHDLLTDDFAYQHGSGKLLTKAQYIDLLYTGGITVTQRGELSLRIRDYGDTIITYGSSTMAGEIFGGAYDGRLRCINIWRRLGNGKWQLAHRNSELLSD